MSSTHGEPAYAEESHASPLPRALDFSRLVDATDML